MSNAEQPNGRPVHGGVKPAELRALGLRPEDVLDFSASVSPIGLPAGVWEALRQVDLAAYPDPSCLELREALSHRLSVRLENILVANGSTEIIHLLARAYLSRSGPEPSSNVLLLTATYGEYTGACRLMGAGISCFEAKESSGFRWDMAEAASRVDSERPTLVFVCNPNNPTGVFLGSEDVRTLGSAVSSYGGLLVIDEAYISFVDDPWDSIDLALSSDVILLRSMTKDYALTGLRLGYGLGTEDVIERLAAFQPDWSVNGLAQAAGIAALADTGYLGRAKAAVDQPAEPDFSDPAERSGEPLPPKLQRVRPRHADAGAHAGVPRRRIQRRR